MDEDTKQTPGTGGTRPVGAQAVVPVAPRHPLVIDPVTRLARLVTQDDIHRMEAICSAYNVLIGDARALVEKAEAIRERANHAYG